MTQEEQATAAPQYQCRLCGASFDRHQLDHGMMIPLHGSPGPMGEQGCYGSGHPPRDTAALDAARERVRELEAELTMWRPLTPEEAERALDEAEAVPLSEERIKDIVERALDPGERIPNSEQAQMAVRIRDLAQENKKLRAAIVRSGYGLLVSADKWTIHPVSPEAKHAEEVEGRLIAENITLTKACEAALEDLEDWPGKHEPSSVEIVRAALSHGDKT